MRAVVFTAEIGKAQEIIGNYYERADIQVRFVDSIVDMNNLENVKVTIVYEYQSEIDLQLEKEFQTFAAEVEAKKKRKQPTRTQLVEKLNELGLDDLEVVRSGDKWQLKGNYRPYELVYECKTATGISRKLTAIYWEREITRLRNLGYIQ